MIYRNSESGANNYVLPIKPIVVRARTHAEFINKVFGTNYKAWMKCSYPYSSNIIVWMVRFDGVNFDFKNRFVEGEEKIEESYCGKANVLRNYSARLAVSVEDYGCGRMYVVKGLYKYVPEESSLNILAFRRIPHEEACKIAPKFYENTK